MASMQSRFSDASRLFSSTTTECIQKGFLAFVVAVHEMESRYGFNACSVVK
jgi:hypothetical protein